MCSLYELLYLTNSIATLFHPPWGPGFKVLQYKTAKTCRTLVYLEVEQLW